MGRITVELKSDHIHGGFEWEIEPNCKCGQLAQAIRDKIIFVSNYTDFNASILYILPIHSDGFQRTSMQIAYCPWCGDRVKAKKKFPTQCLKMKYL